MWLRNAVLMVCVQNFWWFCIFEALHQALVPLSSMEVDEVYDGRYSYAWCYEVKYVVISAEEHIYNDEQAEILVTDHSGNQHRRKHINTKIYGIRDAVLNGDE